MAPDFRSDPMESAEGRGFARRAWESYARGVSWVAPPALRSVTDHLAITKVDDLLGFWLTWHLHGGFEGLEDLGMHRATIFRKVKRFRTVFGVHPDEFRMPGVKIHPAEYWKDAARRSSKRK